MAQARPHVGDDLAKPPFTPGIAKSFASGVRAVPGCRCARRNGAPRRLGALTPDARFLLASFNIPFSNTIVGNNIVGKWRMSSGKCRLPEKNSEPPRGERGLNTGDGLAKRRKRCDFAKRKQRAPLQAFEKRIIHESGHGPLPTRIPPEYSAGRLAPARVGLRVVAYRLRRGLHRPELAAAIPKKASRRRPFRNPPILPASPCAACRPQTRARKSGRLQRPSPGEPETSRIRRQRRVRGCQSKLPGRKAENAAAPRPDRYAAQISSTIDSEASATSATSVRPPSNTATSTANRRRSPTSR